MLRNDKTAVTTLYGNFRTKKSFVAFYFSWIFVTCLLFHRTQRPQCVQKVGGERGKMYEKASDSLIGFPTCLGSLWVPSQPLPESLFFISHALRPGSMRWGVCDFLCLSPKALAETTFFSSRVRSRSRGSFISKWKSIIMRRGAGGIMEVQLCLVDNADLL